MASVDCLTTLQKRVIGYGHQSIVGCIVLGIFVSIIGLGIGIYTLFIADEYTDECWDFYCWHVVSYLTLGLTIFCIFGAIYGKYLKQAAEERDIDKLWIWSLIWVTIDMIFLVVVMALVVLMQAFEFLLVLIAIAVDFYRINTIRKLIQECKADDTYSA